MTPVLRYFVVRPASEVVLPSGEVEKRAETIVPLIPMDLIPDGIDIMGIPRLLTLSQTMGMTNVGTSTLESDCKEGHTVTPQQPGGSTSKAAAISPSAGPERPEHIAGYSPGSRFKHRHSISQISQAPQKWESYAFREPRAAAVITETPKTPTTQHHQPLAVPTASPESLPSSYRQRTPRSRSSSSPPVDEIEEPLHCQPWCHHGVCPRGDACRSKHEMPTTLDGLKKVGLEKMPYWYSHSKGQREWHNLRKEKWTAKKTFGRTSNDSLPRSAHWSLPRQHARPAADDYRARVRAENLRAMELMNQDNPAEQGVRRQEVRPEIRTGERLARENQDLISIGSPESVSHPVMDVMNK